MRKLNERMKTFCEEYIKNGYNGTQAYMTAYESDNNKTASVEASRMLKDPRIQEELNNVESTFRVVGYQAGITKAVIMKRLADMLDAKKSEKDGTEKPDYTAINNAITTYAKLTGDFTERKQLQIDDKRDVADVDVAKMSKEDRAALKEQILNEL